MAALNGSERYLCCSRYYSLSSSKIAPRERCIFTSLQLDSTDTLLGKTFVSLRSILSDSGTTMPAIQWVSWALYVVLIRPDREAHHLTPSGVEVVNDWRYILTPLYAFMTFAGTV